MDLIDIEIFLISITSSSLMFHENNQCFPKKATTHFLLINALVSKYADKQSLPFGA